MYKKQKKMNQLDIFMPSPYKNIEGILTACSAKCNQAHLYRRHTRSCHAVTHA